VGKWGVGGGLFVVANCVDTHQKEGNAKGDVKEVKAKMIGIKFHHHCHLCLSSFEPMPYLQ